MITISRWELYSFHASEEIELNQELIDDVLSWTKDQRNWDREIKNYEDFLEALEEFHKDYEIHDSELAEKICDSGGEYYPGNDNNGHDWNHFDYDLDENEIRMIEEALKRFNDGK